MNKPNKKLPDSPGVYIFKKGRTILYIGKATSLRDRVRSYFSSSIIETRGPAIVSMVALASDIDFKKTDSVLEALILESALIKKYQPKYNTREKDDRSYYFVAISNEDFPRVYTIRGKELAEHEEGGFKEVFGPFPHGSELKDALKIIRKIFPFRDKCKPNSGKLCFEAQIGLCPGVCGGEVSMRQYAQNLQNIKRLFRGEKLKIFSALKSQMNKYARGQKFELANEIKKQIFGLKHIEDVSLIKSEPKPRTVSNEKIFRIEAYDISHTANKNRVGVMVVIENGEIKRSEYRKFKIKDEGKVSGDTNDLAQVLDRRLNHEEWRLPDIIVVDGSIAQINSTKKILGGLHLDISVVAVTKDKYHRPKKIVGDMSTRISHEREILLANNEAHRFAISYHKKIRKII